MGHASQPNVTCKNSSSGHLGQAVFARDGMIDDTEFTFHANPFAMSRVPAVAAVSDRRQYSNLRDRRRSWVEAARCRVCASRTAATAAALDFFCETISPLMDDL